MDKILACDYEMPSEDKIPLDAQDLIKKLLVLDPFSRLGSGMESSENGIDALKAHQFFSSINF